MNQQSQEEYYEYKWFLFLNVQKAFDSNHKIEIIIANVNLQFESDTLRCYFSSNAKTYFVFNWEIFQEYIVHLSAFIEKYLSEVMKFCFKNLKNISMFDSYVFFI